jgi:thiol-disulfide isomerase/thioredoxin
MTNDAPNTGQNDSNSGNKKTFMSGLMKALVPLVVILAIIVVGLQLVKYKLNSETSTAQPQGGGDVATLSEGTVLPDFDLQTLEGKKLKFSDLKAKVVLINFWATWCEACVIEMPSIVKLYQSYKDKGLEIVGVNLDEKPDAVVPKAVKQLKIDFPIYVDSSGALANLFDVHAIPLTVILNHDRKILYVEGGERDWTDSEIKTKMDQWVGQN